MAKPVIDIANVGRLDVVELRGRDEDLSAIGGLVEYVPQN